MDVLQRHETFEIEALQALKNSRVLDPLVFGGGTMLRLCHELNRYSADLDFWFVKRVPYKGFFARVTKALARMCEITDACEKFNTLLFEVRTGHAPRRLKIEIRKGVRAVAWEEKIAFSRHSTAQVLLKALTLDQAMKNKIDAALDRGDIRDFFDMEFLVRQGVSLPVSPAEKGRLLTTLGQFKEKDFKVTLGSLLEGPLRRYYVTHKFEYLAGKLRERG